MAGEGCIKLYVLNEKANYIVLCAIYRLRHLVLTFETSIISIHFMIKLDHEMNT